MFLSKTAWAAGVGSLGQVSGFLAGIAEVSLKLFKNGINPAQLPLNLTLFFSKKTKITNKRDVCLRQ
jgi:hypothetical protein